MTNGNEVITDGFKVLTSSGAVNDPFCVLCSLDCSSRRRDLVVDPNDHLKKNCCEIWWLIQMILRWHPMLTL